jgi:hypothetical protein
MVRNGGKENAGALIQGESYKRSEMRRASWRISDAPGLKLVQDIETKINIAFFYKDV